MNYAALTGDGSNIIFGAAFGITPAIEELVVQLITDENVPTSFDDLASHTVATGGGYADRIITTKPALGFDGDGNGQAFWGVQEFVFTGPLTGNPQITGYRVLSSSGVAMFTVLFDPSLWWAPTNNGDNIPIYVAWVLGNCPLVV